MVAFGIRGSSGGGLGVALVVVVGRRDISGGGGLGGRALVVVVWEQGH